MIQYKRLTTHEIATIFDGYSINDISSFKLLTGGSENTNYVVIAKNDKYVLTICEQKSESKTRDLAYLLEHLEKHDFVSSKIVRSTKNESVFLWQTKPVMVKKYIEGKVLKILPDHLLELLGKEMAKLHKIEAPEYLPKQIGYGKEQFREVEKYAANSLFDIWLKEKTAYLTPYFSLNLPRALIHSDVFADNVIVSNHESSVIIMDFEDSAYYYRIFDIGMMIIGICGNGKTIDFEKVRYLLKGYLQENQLMDIELNALQAFTVYAGTAMTFWRHLNFNYTKPNSKLSNHYLGLKALTDYVHEQPEACFTKLL